jgi:hypothetical protein
MTALLFIQAAVRQDTIVTVAARDAYDLVFMLAAGAAFLVFLGAVLFIAYLLIQMRRAAKAVRAARERLSLDPGIESLRNVAKNLEAISSTMHDEVGRLSNSVSQISDRLAQASDRMEERIEDFNAFLEVVQREAEEAFVDSAATARGVRAGLGSLRHQPDGTSAGTLADGREREELGRAGGAHASARQDEEPPARDADREG